MPRKKGSRCSLGREDRVFLPVGALLSLGALVSIIVAALKGLRDPYDTCQEMLQQARNLDYMEYRNAVVKLYSLTNCTLLVDGQPINTTIYATLRQAADTAMDEREHSWDIARDIICGLLAVVIVASLAIKVLRAYRTATVFEPLIAKPQVSTPPGSQSPAGPQPPAAAQNWRLSLHRAPPAAGEG